MEALEAAVLVLTGAAAGFLSSLLGIGGGILMVPVLHYGLGFAWLESTAISLGAITIQSPYGVYQHVRRKAVDWRIALGLALGGLPGIWAGTWLETRVPVPWIKLVFAATMLLAAYRLVAKPPTARIGRPGWALLVALGAGAGVLAKLLGIGGGLLTVPVLALGGTAVHVAVGSSLVPVFTNAAVATARDLAVGLPWMPALVLGGAALAGVPAGAWAAHAMDASRLRRVFAVAITAAAVLVAATARPWA